MQGNRESRVLARRAAMSSFQKRKSERFFSVRCQSNQLISLSWQ
jgi:hypothetical protein